jgi:hypothetical protein
MRPIVRAPPAPPAQKHAGLLPTKEGTVKKTPLADRTNQIA